MKKEIKKLRRYRDQIKTWIQSTEIKDKKVFFFQCLLAASKSFLNLVFLDFCGLFEVLFVKVLVMNLFLNLFLITYDETSYQQKLVFMASNSIDVL